MYQLDLYATSLVNGGGDDSSREEYTPPIPGPYPPKPDPEPVEI